MLEELRQKLKKEFGITAKPFEKNMLLVEVDKNNLQKVGKFIKKLGFTYVHTVSVVDYTPKGRGFQVSYFVENLDEKQFVVLRTEVLDSEPSLPSLCSIFPAVQPHEREAWEMFGIEFIGNPKLEVMLLPSWAEGWFPLRKSYKLKKHKKG